MRKAKRRFLTVLVSGLALILLGAGATQAFGKKCACPRRAPSRRVLSEFSYEPTHWRPWPDELLGCRPGRLDPHPYDRRPSTPKQAPKSGQ